MTPGFTCDNCHEFTQSKAWIFNCIECQKEICESCMYSWATCKECAVGKTDTFLAERFNNQESPDIPSLLTNFLTRNLSKDVES